MTRAVTPLRDAKALLSWVSLLRRERPELIVGATPKAATLSLIAARIAGVPTRVFNVWGARWDGMHGSRARILMTLDKLTATSATHVVAVSPSLAQLFVDHKITTTRPDVIGRGGSKGVNIERFTPQARDADRPPTLGFVGRLSIDKGILDLLKVFEVCRVALPDLRLVIAGDIDDAQPIPEELIQRLRSDPQIRWLGSSDEIPELMPTFDVLVFPSIREGLPNVVIEAAASGVPVVGYDTTGVRDAVEDGITGYLVPLGNVERLAQATADVLKSPNQSEMREAARAFAVRWFSQDKVVRDFVDYLEDAIRQTNP